MSPNQEFFIIVTLEETTQELLNKSVSRSLDRVRASLDKTKVLLQIKDDFLNDPEVLPHRIYDLNEVKDILKSPEWSSPNPFQSNQTLVQKFLNLFS